MSEEILNDARVRELKEAATKGSEHGPLYDQGVLAVVNAVEGNGRFHPSRWISALTMADAQRKSGTQMLSEEEDSAVLQFLRENSWTLEEAERYCAGVAAAEKVLEPFAQKEDVVATPESILHCCTPCPKAGCSSRCIKIKSDDGQHECENGHTWQVAAWG